MPDLPALDVAIGLVFLYIVLALVCSTLNETISTTIGLRARFLQLGILNLLSASSATTKAGMETTKSFYRHPLVQGLIRPGRGPDFDPTSATKWWRKPPYPSYLPSRTFIAALTDLARDAEAKLDQADEDEAAAARARIKGLRKGLERSLAAIPNERLSEAMLALYRSAGNDGAKFQHAAEQWFDDSMERVSGWYKRRVQLFLAVIATSVICLLNADTLTAARVLWRDDATRAAAVTRAQAAATGTAGDIKLDEAVKNLDLPLGWELSFGDGPTQLPNDVLSWLAKLVGLALTIGAVMLGAPFWFDLLSKVVRVRATGSPPPASDAVRSGEGEQSRAGPGAAKASGTG
ncbi:MAG: hypothetical protein QOF45_2406 [Gaiellaceae bacterium]|jgi:hypothetical protein|nr:hypothetical protein [Gaiellaceae bacterium]